jgi:hypothetical protein
MVEESDVSGQIAPSARRLNRLDEAPVRAIGSQPVIGLGVCGYAGQTYRWQAVRRKSICVSDIELTECYIADLVETECMSN